MTTRPFQCDVAQEHTHTHTHTIYIHIHIYILYIGIGIGILYIYIPMHFDPGCRSSLQKITKTKKLEKVFKSSKYPYELVLKMDLLRLKWFIFIYLYKSLHFVVVCFYCCLTVGLEGPWLTAAATSLVDGFDDEDILRPALQTMDSVVVLLDVGHNHPAVHGVTQTWQKRGSLIVMKYSSYSHTVL